MFLFIYQIKDSTLISKIFVADSRWNRNQFSLSFYEHATKMNKFIAINIPFINLILQKRYVKIH